MIPRKKKPCKGTGKAKNFTGCQEVTYLHRYGLCTQCFGEWLYSTGEGKEVLSKSIHKAQAPRKALEKAIETHKAEKGLATLLTNVKNVCHKYVRLRDEGKPCISCGTPYKSNFQAGHFYKAELFSTLRFNEYNINGQCEQCNLREEGNLNHYELNLPNRIGEDKFNEIKRLAIREKQTSHKWNREALKAIRIYYQQKIKNL
jgi:hypothetical protein